MKQFNLKSYIANPRKVMTKDGRDVRILCVDAKGDYPVVALIPDGEGEYKRDHPEMYTEDGCSYSGRMSFLDLFFATKKCEGWVNVFKNDDGENYATYSVYKSKEEAEEDGKQYSGYITSIEIKWEEDL